jgi:hypothetical protein
MVPKNAGVLEDHSFRFVRNLVTDFVSWTNGKQQALSSARNEYLILEAYKNYSTTNFL